jgi:hypothetical protein
MPMYLSLHIERCRAVHNIRINMAYIRHDSYEHTRQPGKEVKR